MLRLQLRVSPEHAAWGSDVLDFSYQFRARDTPELDHRCPGRLTAVQHVDITGGRKLIKLDRQHAAHVLLGGS